MVHNACFPILVLIRLDLRDWGRYRIIKLSGFRDAKIDSVVRVERGGRVERDRNASEDAPMG
jgi:hypothetical protein